jgi:hypothetical protein
VFLRLAKLHMAVLLTKKSKVRDQHQALLTQVLATTACSLLRWASCSGAL